MNGVEEGFTTSRSEARGGDFGRGGRVFLEEFVVIVEGSRRSRIRSEIGRIEIECDVGPLL